MRKVVAVAACAAAALMLSTAPAGAESPPPGCVRIPILGLDPHVRTICDTKIRPDGSWTRFRGDEWIQSTRSSCDGVYYKGGQCPPWLENDVVPGHQSPVEQYIVTAETIPPGEPGHIDGAEY